MAAVAAMRDPVRRALYELVTDRQPVGREEAAKALDLPASTVAFHLDRLVEAGLLETAHRRLSGRTGPGAGRPAKLYSLTQTEIAVSVPQRQYDLMADVLATAIETTGDTEAPAGAVKRVARERGAPRREMPDRSTSCWPRPATGRPPTSAAPSCATARSTRWRRATAVWCAPRTTRS